MIQEAHEALESVDPERLQRKWGWMTKYVRVIPASSGLA